MEEPQNDNKKDTTPVSSSSTSEDTIVTSKQETNHTDVAQKTEEPSLYSASDDSVASLQEPSQPDQRPKQKSISWSAPEFHDHEKSARWYVYIVFGIIVLAAALYLLSRSIMTPIVVIFGGIVIIYYANNKPGDLQYQLTRQGIQIGKKYYTYDEFRLFVVVPDSPLPEFMLIPVKRFMPALSVRYASDDENKIFTMLSEYLPYVERRPDLIESIMHRIHF
jgi:hypothetical protein